MLRFSRPDILVLLAALIISGAAAQDRRGGRGSTREFLGLGPPPDQAAAERGAKVYASNCAFCHGEKANGGEGPDLVRSSVVLHDEKGELIGPVIHNGRAEQGMPAFPNFTKDQLYELAEFLHLKVELAANRGLYKPLNVVTGDPKAGKAYFDAHCASCHSPEGDLAHIASKMQPADLQQTFLYPGARGYMPGAPRITSVTVTLPSGEAVSGVLKRLDDFHVSLTDSSGEYHSFALGPGVKVDIDDKLQPHRRLLDQYTDDDIHNITAYLATLK
jgi:mono/diheme cytochrome c family protein